MAIKSPVAVFVAETNVEAHVVANLLQDSGIEAHAVEDVSPAGMFSVGTLDEIHRPKVFVDSTQLAAAREVVASYQTGSPAEHASPSSCCYFCGAACEPNAAKCPSCGQLLEGGDDEDAKSRESSLSGPPPTATGYYALRNIKRLVAIVLLVPIVFYLGLLLFAAVTSVVSSMSR
ncbi:MAG TPA: DUF2007 domain-containing protein [Pirellulaceae bacterium]|nr:DUF2007 domain-containing protein [Pirellulaceae bacterium]